MIRNTFLAALTASLMGSLTMAATADAGGGVRLGFGGPMASFVAVPTHGGGGASRYAAPAPKCAKSRSPSYAASRSVSAPKIARVEQKPVRREKVQLASVQNDPPKSKPVIKVAQRSVTKSEKVVTTAASTPKTVVSASAGPSASLALAQTDNAASVAAADAEIKAAETQATEAQAAATKAAETTAAETSAGEAIVVAETKAEPDVATPVVAAAETQKAVGCKKFIPSVGVTIDVICKK